MPPILSDELLRRDVRLLGDLLGEVITELAGKEALALVEEIRRLARDRRAGSPEAERQLSERIAGLSEAEARVVARAFSVFFDVSNLAEDRHRVRVLRHRERESRGLPLGESIGAAIALFKEQGLAAEQVQDALNRLRIELVFTAHPSEAKRRSIRAKLRRMRQAITELDRDDLLPRERTALQTSLKTELTTLWQTDFLRHSRPTVLQEVERGLSIAPRLWETIPHVYGALRRTLRWYYPHHEFQIPTFLGFGSWMGGDRDGNPFVTAEITAKTLSWLRETAIRLHLGMGKQLSDFLSLSAREVAVDQALSDGLARAVERWPALQAVLDPLSPHELYRRWLTMIQWRLQQSQSVRLFSPPPAGAYRDGVQLEADLGVLCHSLRAHHGEVIEDEVLKWLDLVRVFGLHLTRLDVRQDARRYSEVMTEILRAAGIEPDYAALDEPGRQAALTRSMPCTAHVPETDLSPLAKDTLALFRVLRGGIQAYGGDAFGAHVISLTHQPSDVLTVLWLWQWSQGEVGRMGEHPDADDPGELRIAPLFEKIGDLRDARDILNAILQHPSYRKHLARQHDRQMVMVGYSDSTKDGGYLAACWGLYRAQADLQRAARESGVQITFFHGRGGSLGRGGGPAARGILSLPPEALDGSLRLTEQGEVLAERYDDPQIAYRHLEQVTWATLVGGTKPPQRSPEREAGWAQLMERLAARSYAAYRELVDRPGFIRFFSLATPIDEIENLPIASRPARRRGERTLDDLRAIPWVFSWTQNRCLVPAWYGLGTALRELRETDPAAWAEVQTMYSDWPFFQATIDNATLALAKFDRFIAGRYAQLLDDPELERNFWTVISQEQEQTRAALLDIVGGRELLDTTPWLQRSIEVRNPYVDPLNLIQIELLRRRRAAAVPHDESDPLRDLLRLTIQGIAAGLRTTG